MGRLTDEASARRHMVFLHIPTILGRCSAWIQDIADYPPQPADLGAGARLFLRGGRGPVGRSHCRPLPQEPSIQGDVGGSVRSAHPVSRGDPAALLAGASVGLGLVASAAPPFAGSVWAQVAIICLVTLAAFVSGLRLWYPREFASALNFLRERLGQAILRT